MELRMRVQAEKGRIAAIKQEAEREERELKVWAHQALSPVSAFVYLIAH